MDSLTKKILLTQINLISQQLQALQSVILHTSAEHIEPRVTSQKSEHELSHEIDKELGLLFENIAKDVEVQE